MDNLIEGIKKTKWTNILIFYTVACVLTFLFRQIPNLLNKISVELLDFNITFNYNHGLALLITSIAAYKIFRIKREMTLLGNKPVKAIIFLSVVLIGYAALGFNNEYGINSHLWALIFCILTLIYDLLEESFWRGLLNDSLNLIPFWLRGIITGILWALWHLLIFDNFDQFGGLFVFILFSIILSIIMAYTADKTKSVLVAASIHTLLCRTNYVTLICAVIWVLIIIMWNKSLTSDKKIKKVA
ncbi:CAAX prenyl protease-like protein [Flavobacterium sp. 90]|uniref:CPBP family glutamic-type intramembrane protease n=1 Tax=unclassified Flavobacterium TaxID=196869 RepID=UPI000EB1604A|nr:MULTISPECIES: CPBP family glutamic-type intramembrane protease [unclassified Flavobacterium]RKR09227.1 CAAX prenyl protease-like protein [Flavobacterium sp. 81]TCK53011.1 CAAX prenyl protease-like protein [Flavobacterium sp. 90]